MFSDSLHLTKWYRYSSCFDRCTLFSASSFDTVVTTFGMSTSSNVDWKLPHSNIILPMSSHPLSVPSGPRPRRSYTSLPQYDGSKDASDSTKEHKKHRSRHSLHHHLPHPYRRLKDSQPSSNIAVLGSNSFRPLVEKHENVASTIEDIRPQSLVPVDGATESAAAHDLAKPEDVERERQRTEVRNKLVGNGIDLTRAIKLMRLSNRELRTILQSLSELSMSTTRKLDDIYYSILEKVSILQSTVGSLQELSSLTRQLRHDFDDEAETLQDDMQEQINGFGGFNLQKSRIDSLESRIKGSREKADKLSERLQAAQERIHVLEVKEGEWQTTVNRRFTIFWTILGIIAALIVAITIFNFTNPAARQAAANATMPNSNTSSRPVSTPLAAIEISVSKQDTSSSLRQAFSSSISALEEDPRLRIFDEL